MYEHIKLADIARMTRSSTTIILKLVQEKIPNAKRLMDQKNMRKVREPAAVAAYFKNIRSGQLGAIRNEFWECLPSWSLLGFSLTGSSLLEMQMGRWLKQRLPTNPPDNGHYWNRRF